jgi:hypothetical protein
MADLDELNKLGVKKEGNFKLILDKAKALFDSPPV